MPNFSKSGKMMLRERQSRNMLSFVLSSTSVRRPLMGISSKWCSKQLTSQKFLNWFKLMYSRLSVRITSLSKIGMSYTIRVNQSNKETQQLHLFKFWTRTCGCHNQWLMKTKLEKVLLVMLTWILTQTWTPKFKVKYHSRILLKFNKIQFI